MTGTLPHCSSSNGTLPGKPLFIDEKKTRKRRLPAPDDPRQALDTVEKEMGLIRCSECNLVYSVDSAYDQKAHAKHHKDVNNPPALKLTSVNLQCWKKSCLSIPFAVEDIEVFRILQNGQHAARRIERVINLIVNKEINFFPESCVWGDKRDRIVCAAVKTTHTNIVIVGVGVFEPLREATWHDRGAVIKAKLLGVNRIWVSSSQRRNKIGSRILDCARSWLFLTKLVEKYEVAFSEPTIDGTMFARKYAKRSDNDFLEYVLKF